MFEEGSQGGKGWGVGSRGRAVCMEHWVLRGAVILGPAALSL